MTLKHDWAFPIYVSEFCRDQRLGDVTTTQDLKGGAISLTRRLTTASGATLILKQRPQVTQVQPPDDLYAREAESLQTLKAAGMHTPEVFSFGTDYLLIEDLGDAGREGLPWETLGRAVAHLHQHHNDRFGFAHNNYLGLLPQLNPWMDDGYEFFARNRILRFLDVPMSEQTLTREDRAGLERLASRLRQLIPFQPPALLHGDLWRENVVLALDGTPALLDPAVYYGWPEAELSMARQYEGIPRSFFDAYVEVNPLAEGWWDRLEILFVREILSMIAHFGDRYDALAKLRVILDKYA